MVQIRLTCQLFFLFMLFAPAILSAMQIQTRTTYTNAAYGFSVDVPANWHIYAEIKNDQFNNRAIIDWGLPAVHSPNEGGDIENAVTITAYKRDDITNVADLMHLEFQRLADILVDRQQLSTEPYISYLVTTSRNGLIFKAKEAFAYANGIGYIFVFTSTPGTYDINIPQFDTLLGHIRLFPPTVTPLAETSVALRFDGLYTAKTGTSTIDSSTVDTYTFLRFYDDGTVYTRMVSSTGVHTVDASFGRNGTFDRKGAYTIRGSELSFTVTDSVQTEVYHGQITDGDRLYLQVSSDGKGKRELWFDFVPVK